MAPQLSSLPDNQLVENDFNVNPSIEYNYHLPLAFDVPGDTVTTTMQGLASFMTFNQASHTLTLTGVNSA